MFIPQHKTFPRLWTMPKINEIVSFSFKPMFVPSIVCHTEGEFEFAILFFKFALCENIAHRMFLFKLMLWKPLAEKNDTEWSFALVQQNKFT